MKTKLLSALFVGLMALLPAPRAEAGIDVDFRLELGWRADYQHDFDAAVILYEYSGYRGRRLVLYPGEQLDDFYDYEWGFRVRSVEVIGPIHVVLFDESNLWGHELTLYGNVDDLSDYRMRLNDYSTFSWHRRARSAYVSFNQANVSVTVDIGPRIYPRIYIGHPISPIYYNPWPNYSWYCPRPIWRYDRWRHRAPVPPPNARPYRPDHRSPVNPPRRQVGYPPNSAPPSTPPPATRPPNVPSFPGSTGSTQPPSRSPRSNEAQPPSRNQTSRPPAAPPSMQNPTRNRPETTPQRTPDRAPTTRRDDNNSRTPPSAQPPSRNSNQNTSSATHPQTNPPSRPSTTSATRGRSQPPSSPPSASSSSSRGSTSSPPSTSAPSRTRTSAPSSPPRTSPSSARPSSRPSSPAPSRPSSPSRSNTPSRPR